MTKKFISIIVSVSIVLSVFIYFNFVRGLTQDINFLAINQVKVYENGIDLHVSNPNSGMMISGIDKTYKNNTLYLKIRGALANEFGNSIEDGKISIDGNYENVNEIVLLGNHHQKKLIWTK